MFEFAKSIGQIRFHLFAICADRQTNKLLRQAEGGESQEVADALAKWAWGALSPTVTHHGDTPEGGLDLPNVRTPDGVCAPKKTATQQRYSSGKQNRPGRTT